MRKGTETIRIDGNLRKYMYAALQHGGRVYITGIGAFEVKPKKAGKSFNGFKGEYVETTGNRVVFTPSKTLKRKIN